MFSGESLTTIDTKGRTSIPAKFRELLITTFNDERFVITKASPVLFDDGSYGRGLSVYPLAEWQELEKKDARKLDTLENQDIQKLKQALIDNNPRWQMIYKMAQINMSQRQMAGALQLSDSTVFREYAKMKELGLLPKTVSGQLCLEV